MNNSLTINDIKDLFILRRVSGDQAMEVFRECPVIEMDKGETLIRPARATRNSTSYLRVRSRCTSTAPRAIPWRC